MANMFDIKENAATGTTASGSIRVDPMDQLRIENEYLRIQLSKLKHLLHDKEDLIRQLQMTSNFTDAEISFILMRCHPDRNPDSKIAHGLTQKLLSKRKKV